MKFKYDREFGWLRWDGEEWRYSYSPEFYGLDSADFMDDLLDAERESLGETIDEEIPEDFLGLYL